MMLVKSVLLGVMLLLAGGSSNSQEKVLNEVVFSVASKSSTRRDMEIYQVVLKEYFQKNRISEYTKKDTDDFLLSRLAYQEAVTFDFGSVEPKKKSSDVKKNGFSVSEVQNEIAVLSKALAYMELKENQIKEPVRFKNWFDLLSRKYQVKYKSK